MMTVKDSHIEIVDKRSEAALELARAMGKLAEALAVPSTNTGIHYDETHHHHQAVPLKSRRSGK